MSTAISAPVDLFYPDARVLVRGLPGRVDLQQRTSWPLVRPSYIPIAAYQSVLERGNLPELTVLKARARSGRPGRRRSAWFDVAIGKDATVVVLDVAGQWVTEGPEARIRDAAGQLAERLRHVDVQGPATCQPSLRYVGGDHPRAIQLEVTTHCNLRCGYCTNRLLTSKQHTPWDRLLRMLDAIDFREVTRVELTGLGEALMHPDLGAIISEIRRRGTVKNVGINTNGTLLTLERCRPLLDAGLTRISVSLDSLDKERFAAARTGGSLDIVRGNVVRLAEFRRQSGARFALGLKAVVVDDPYGDAERILAFSAEHGLDQPQFVTLDRRKVATPHYPPALSANGPSDSEATIASWAERRWNELTERSTPSEPEPRRHQLPWSHPHLRNYLHVCGWVLDSAYVCGDGACLPCCEQLTDFPRGHMGSVLDRPLTELWNDQLLYGYRLPLSLGFVPTSCEGCDYAPWDGQSLTGWVERQAALSRLEDEDQFDRRFGTDTTIVEFPIDTATISREAVRSAAIYWPTLPRTFQKIMNALDIEHEDFVFVDLGAGKGRTLLLASDFPFKRVIGVELFERYCAIARHNVRTYRSPAQRCTAIDIVCSDASTYELPPENTVFYFFDPFERPVLARVVENIVQSLRSRPRKVAIVYVRLPSEKEDLFSFLTPAGGAEGGSPERHPEFAWRIFVNRDETADPIPIPSCGPSSRR